MCKIETARGTVGLFEEINAMGSFDDLIGFRGSTVGFLRPC